MENSVILSLDTVNVVHLTLNRPEVHNAMNEEMVESLIKNLENIHNMTEARALILKGNGSSFCSGADLSSMKKSYEYSQKKNYEEATKLSTMLNLLDTLEIPTIAYVQGIVMGGGLGLISCTDIVLSDYHTVFSFPEVKLGIVPAVISPYVLRAIGPRQASRYFLTGEKFDSKTAQQIGLIHENVELDLVQESLEKMINQILSAGPHAVKRAKKLIREISGSVPEDIRKMTSELIADLRVLDEGQEGLSAYLNKTLPTWVPK